MLKETQVHGNWNCKGLKCCHPIFANITCCLFLWLLVRTSCWMAGASVSHAAKDHMSNKMEGVGLFGSSQRYRGLSVHERILHTSNCRSGCTIFLHWWMPSWRFRDHFLPGFLSLGTSSIASPRGIFPFIRMMLFQSLLQYVQMPWDIE